jgi:hypothetical protein
VTATYETAVALIEQLLPIDQARLFALLAERLQHSMQSGSATEPGDDSAFWHTPIEDDTPLSTETPGGAATRAIVARWFGAPLLEEDALELASR